MGGVLILVGVVHLGRKVVDWAPTSGVTVIPSTLAPVLGAHAGKQIAREWGTWGEHPARSCPPTRPKQPDLNVTAAMLASPGSQRCTPTPCPARWTYNQKKIVAIYVIILPIVTTGDGTHPH